VVVNRAPRDRFRVGELRAELGGWPGIESVSVLPEDRRVANAAWDGVVVPDSAFTRALATLEAAVRGRGDSGARGHSRRRRSRRVMP
jgi:hypothetical protein